MGTSVLISESWYNLPDDNDPNWDAEFRTGLLMGFQVGVVIAAAMFSVICLLYWFWSA